VFSYVAIFNDLLRVTTEIFQHMEILYIRASIVEFQGR
jgi:hypothetical protein